MNKACKELIKNAKPYNGEEIGILYIINSGKRYDGLWGSNNYNNIVLIGQNRPKSPNAPIEFYKLSTDHQSDKVCIQCLRQYETCNIDIDSELNCVRVWFNETLIIQMVLSDIILVPAKSEVAKKYGSF